jgi:dethiobiotin synthetase
MTLPLRPRLPAVRPPLLLLVAGTGTEVGKTWVAAALARHLAAGGTTVAARKPAQSFAAGDDAAGVTDAHVLAGATGDRAEAVCPPDRWYATPMAPPMAAAAEGRPPFTIADLAAEIAFPEGVDVGLVETAGGVRSPLADDGDTVSLAVRLRPDVVVLVADAGLGTINAVRLSADALAAVGAPVLVVLNRHDAADELHRRNAEWLHDRVGVVCVVDVAELAGELEHRTHLGRSPAV